jgi:curved DNA-binding protein CbpA
LTKHHATLGLARLDATPEEIHAAYIALAKVRHPDRGGDPEAFRAISEAYAALRDDKEKDEEDSFAHSLVARMMGQALDQVGDGAIYADPVEAMIKACTQALAEIDKSVANMRRKVVRYSKFANRFGTKDGGDNVLRAMVDASIAQIESQIEAATLFKERHEKARALLERHSFDVDGETAQARLMNRLGY